MKFFQFFIVLFRKASVSRLLTLLPSSCFESLQGPCDNPNPPCKPSSPLGVINTQACTTLACSNRNCKKKVSLLQKASQFPYSCPFRGLFLCVNFPSVVSISQSQNCFYSYAKVQEKNLDSLFFTFSSYLQNEENLFLLKFRLITNSKILCREHK